MNRKGYNHTRKKEWEIYKGGSMKLETYIKDGYVEIASLPYKQNKRIIQCVKWKEGKQEEIYLIEEKTLLDCEECKDTAIMQMFFYTEKNKLY